MFSKQGKKNLRWVKQFGNIKLKKLSSKKKKSPPPSKILYFSYIFLIFFLYFVGKYNKNIRFFIVGI